MNTHTLTWYRAELDYDIASEAWILYDANQNLEPHLRHQIADLTTGENRNRISRLLAEAFAEVVRAIGKNGATRLRREDSLHAPKGYRLRLTIPDHAVMPLVERVHAFLVACVLGRALINLLPTEAARFAKEGDSRLEAIAAAALSFSLRGATLRRPLSPF